MGLIRIVPEWNVKIIAYVNNYNYDDIRIVPEWNVKVVKMFNGEPLSTLESYQSGM